ncbi:MAG TPA: plastocyanin/azurin family copper-binding protein [Nitrososphaeraceae archaeon]|nr:plastocyanin/azurin family copper-binding protein [Nitrososphaeraceae archaeon]
MKLLTSGVIMGLLVTGLLLSPFVSGFPFITKVMAQEEEEADGPVKQALLIANENKVKIAPDNALHPGGIEYAAMTFNGTIPGPIMAVDQGDTLNVTIRNDGKTIHSLDFHAGIGPSKVLSGNIAPGETKSVAVEAINPGAYLYHCGADGLNGVWEHIANGMYGIVVVHPENEEPAKEFYLSFGENFNTADKGLFVGANGTTGTFDLTKFATQQPDLILTNGMAHKYAPGIGEASKIVLNENPEIFKVTPGELTRWYILSPGPNEGTAFHFISGQITVRDGSNPAEDDYGTQEIDDETWWIPPGSASVIESVFPEAGTYIGVDHNMNHVVRGAALAVVADGNATDTDHPPGTGVAPKGSDSPVAEWGKPMPYEQIIAEASAQPAAGSTTSNATLAYAQEGAITPEGTINDTMSMGNDTSMMMNATLAFAQEGFQTEDLVNETIDLGNNTATSNATLAFAQEQVSIAAGSSNPSASEFYVPSEISVSAGSTVTWTNDDSTIHTVVEGGPQGGGAGATPAFDSSIIAPGATWENTFDTAGEFDYYCNLHPFMTGKVTVT